MEKKKEGVDCRIVITAIIALVLLEGWALYNGINGKLMSVIVAIVAGLAGWTLPTPKVK